MPHLSDWRRSNNRRPAFTDTEVITIALMQGCLGVSTLKDAYRIVAENFRFLFPHLCSYERWIVRLHQLTPLIGHLIRAALKDAELFDTLYLMDSKPIPMCKPVRHGRVRLLSDEGAAFGKNSVGWFYGFKLHLVVLLHRSDPHRYSHSRQLERPRSRSRPGLEFRRRRGVGRSRLSGRGV